jgi:hypothetical protein
LALNNEVCEKIKILTGTSVTINTLADFLIKEIGAEVMKISKQLKMGDPEHSNGTIKKMKRKLNVDFSSMTSLNAGLNKTIDYIRNERD